MTTAPLLLDPSRPDAPAADDLADVFASDRRLHPFHARRAAA
jgi:hypothetical protein